MSKKCQVSKKSYNAAHAVSFSHKKTKYRQHANLQVKRLWLPEENRWVRLRVSSKVLKTITNRGLKAALKRYGTDLQTALG